MLDFNLTLENENILLRPVVPNDREELRQQATDPSNWIYFTIDLSVREEFDRWFDMSVSEKEKQNRLPFAVVRKSDGKLMGSSSFANISYRDSRIEIGATWLGREFQGTGTNPQMKYLMFKHAFEVLGMERVEIKTDVLNLPARNAVKKIGAVEEGILRSHTLMTHGRRRDTIFYSILRNEWEGVKLKNNWK